MIDSPGTGKTMLARRLPTINAMMVVGIVSLPGMMTEFMVKTMGKG